MAARALTRKLIREITRLAGQIATVALVLAGGITCFIALQDITVDMGPTVFLPRTHTTASHDQFKHDKENLLRITPHVMAVLPKGSCAIFDSPK